VAQLYPDEHAQALAELRSCSWHVPEHTVAQLIGFDGDVQNLRAWVRKLKMSGMDIAAFNAYEDKTGGDRERWWIIGHLTPKDAGILTTVAEQRTITNILAHEATALRYGINDLSEDQAGAAAVQTWNEVLMDLVFTHPDVFHLRDMLQRFHSAPASRGRPTRRDIANAFTASLRGMLRRGVFSLPEVAAAAAAVSTPSLPAVSTPSTAVPGTPPRVESPPPAETPPPPRIKGEKTVERLITEVARCSMYLNLNDSPNGFDPLAAARSTASASGESSADDVGGSEDEGGDGFDAERPERVQ
jgi:hypothetical protein